MLGPFRPCPNGCRIGSDPTLLADALNAVVQLMFDSLWRVRMPHLHWDRVHPWHICSSTGRCSESKRVSSHKRCGHRTCVGAERRGPMGPGAIAGEGGFRGAKELQGAHARTHACMHARTPARTRTREQGCLARLDRCTAVLCGVEVETFTLVGRTAQIAALLGPSGKQTAAQPLRYECRHRFRALHPCAAAPYSQWTCICARTPTTHSVARGNEGGMFRNNGRHTRKFGYMLRGHAGV